MNGDDKQASQPSVPPNDPAPFAPASGPLTPTPDPAATPQEAGIKEVSWTASEFVAHEKSLSWYGLLALATLVIAGLVYWLSRDWLSIGVLVIVAVLFGIIAGRKPRVLDYHLDRSGLTIGGKPYPYRNFKSFSVVDEGAFSSITLVPLKRFLPPMSIYYSPEDQDAIVQVLGQHLPMTHDNGDALDRLTRRIKF